jgi:hypothetical protein
VPLFVLTVVRQKLYVYLLPTMPPFALLIGRYWQGLGAGVGAARRIRRPVTVLCLAAGATGVLLWVGGWLVHSGFLAAPRDEFAPIIATLTTPHVPLIAGSVLVGMVAIAPLSMRLTARRGVRFGFAGIVVGAAGMFGVLHLVVYSALDDHQSWRLVAEAIKEQQLPGDVLVTYRMKPYVGYYVHEPVVGCRKLPALRRLAEEHSAILSVVPVNRLDEIVHCGDASFDPGVRIPSPRGPVCIVRFGVRHRNSTAHRQSGVAARHPLAN